MATFFESFEGDLNGFIGDVGVYGFNAQNVYDGSFSLNADEGRTALKYVDDIFAPTNTPIGMFVKLFETGNEAGYGFGPVVGVPESSDGTYDTMTGYQATINAHDLTFDINRLDGGSSTQLESQSVSLTTTEWYEISITTWDPGNEIQAQLLDANSNVLADIQTSISQHDGNYIGVATLRSSSFYSTNYVPPYYGDYMYRTGQFNIRNTTSSSDIELVNDRDMAKSRSALLSSNSEAENTVFFTEVFPDENSADLEFDIIYEPVVGFASEFVQEESVFGNETDSFTVVCDSKITNSISVRVQYDSTGDGNIDYTTNPRQVSRNGQVLTFDELGDAGWYRIILSDLRPEDHFRALTWGPTRL